MSSLQRLLVAPHCHQLWMLLAILLIAIVNTGALPAAASNTNHEHFERQQDTESRQFGGFNANAAFNSNFGNSNFGFNLGGNTPTTTSRTATTIAPQYSQPAFDFNTTPKNVNNFNSLSNNYNYNTNKKEQNKNTYNDYHNQKPPGTRIVDNFNHRYPDGSYEYRYELADGTARYERGYFLLYDNKKTLVVVGYYSYRMPDGRYQTVFYNADQNGYRQNQSITPQTYPNLPRSIDVPQFRDAADDYHSRPTVTTPNPRLTTTQPTYITTTRRSGRF